MTSKKYYDHLQSDYWRDVRRAVWRRDKGRCVRCGEPGRHVHHLHYRHVYEELEHLECLDLLCEECHRDAHDIPQVSWAELARRIDRL